MYCGDETGSFIGDVGSSSARFGYGGEDAPNYVVPSYVVSNSNNADNKTVLPSCYNGKWAFRNVQCPMRRRRTALQTTTTTTTTTTPVVDQPVTNPVEFLPQGDCVQDWDAYETLWQNALDVMHVKDTLKHTTGGDKTTTTTTTTAASGVQSATIQRSSNMNDNKCVHPVLVVSPGCTHIVGDEDGQSNTAAAAMSRNRKELLQMTELMLEKFQTTAVFVAPTPMLAAFAHGRQTCLVVDMGAGGCRVTPVVDGLLLKTAQRRNGRGGDWLGNIQWHALIHPHLGTKAGPSLLLRPRYQLSATYQQQMANSNSNNNLQRSGIFHRFAMHDLMYELRSSEHVYLPQWWYDPTVPFVYDTDNDDETMEKNNASDEATKTAAAAKHYELPDGTLVDLTTRIGKDLCRVPELWFTDQTPFLRDDDTNNNNTILQQHSTLSNLPLHKLIHSSLSAVGDVDVRKDLAASIVLTGGCSVTPNLEQRLSLELPRITSSAYKTKVVASKFAVERQCAAWIGGSVLSSLGSFQQLWLSKTEYEEYGGTLAIQRFP